MCESFNNNILEARDKPIASMLEWIRKRVMHRIQIKKEGMEKYTGEICPNIVKDLKALKVQARNCFATYCGDRKFEVDCGDTTHIVDLEEKKCSCRMWDLAGIPCKHAVEIGFPIVAPPLYRKQPGRPPKMRKKGIDEPRNPVRVSRQNRFMVCARCLQKGHNQRSCKGPVHPKSKLFKQKKSNQQQPPSPATITATATATATATTSQPRRKLPSRRANTSLSQPTRVGQTFEEFPSMRGDTSTSQPIRVQYSSPEFDNSSSQPTSYGR
ncbi:uncharacterized protein LOC114261379 [Camellia sinensis]|uniref:uncharacterized protein LOC114261379 n=1 Tax=Camellia sinensis TaxID=4442 RepID=UPI00103676D7|nr:uncharacterized protein LOC114261379 [Camellia sinensis]